MPEFEAGSAGQDRRSDDPDRDTPRSRGRYTDDGDDRIFRQATDDEQGQRARPDRGGSEPGFRHGHLDFIRVAMNMARPHSDDPEAMPTRSPRSLVQGESQASDEFGDRPRGPGTMVSAPRDISGRSTGSQNPGQFDERVERTFTGIGYDALLTSTAGWGSSVKQESDADRPNSVSTKFEFNDDEDYAAFADRRDEEESLARRSARSRAAARPRSLSRGAARDLHVDRDTRSGSPAREDILRQRRRVHPLLVLLRCSVERLVQQVEHGRVRSCGFPLIYGRAVSGGHGRSDPYCSARPTGRKKPKQDYHLTGEHSG